MAEMEALVERMAQIGTVSDVDRENRRVRCIFRETEHTSGWLYVLASPPIIPDQRTEETAGGSGEGAFESHSHGLAVTPWLPQVNDQVLVVYLPVEDSDGFVIGGI